jgi:hypothetical protein
MRWFQGTILLLFVALSSALIYLGFYRGFEPLWLWLYGTQHTSKSIENFLNQEIVLDDLELLELDMQLVFPYDFLVKPYPSSWYALRNARNDLSKSEQHNLKFDRNMRSIAIDVPRALEQFFALNAHVIWGLSIKQSLQIRQDGQQLLIITELPHILTTTIDFIDKKSEGWPEVQLNSTQWTHLQRVILPMVEEKFLIGGYQQIAQKNLEKVIYKMLHNVAAPEQIKFVYKTHSMEKKE